MEKSVSGPFAAAFETYRKVLIRFVYGLAAAAGVSILLMMFLTFIDVFLRFIGRPITGAYDTVMILAAITISGALPYTTAVKGHVAIEFLFQKLNRTGRVIMDTFLHSLSAALFAFLSWQSFMFGNQLKAAGRVSMTLQVPLYWISYMIGISSAVAVLVIIDIVLHPGKEMIKP